MMHLRGAVTRINLIPQNRAKIKTIPTFRKNKLMKKSPLCLSVERAIPFLMMMTVAVATVLIESYLFDKEILPTKSRLPPFQRTIFLSAFSQLHGSYIRDLFLLRE